MLLLLMYSNSEKTYCLLLTGGNLLYSALWQDCADAEECLMLWMKAAGTGRQIRSASTNCHQCRCVVVCCKSMEGQSSTVSGDAGRRCAGCLRSAAALPPAGEELTTPTRRNLGAVSHLSVGRI